MWEEQGNGTTNGWTRHKLLTLRLTPTWCLYTYNYGAFTPTWCLYTHMVPLHLQLWCLYTYNCGAFTPTWCPYTYNYGAFTPTWCLYTHMVPLHLQLWCLYTHIEPLHPYGTFTTYEWKDLKTLIPTCVLFIHLQMFYLQLIVLKHNTQSKPVNNIHTGFEFNTETWTMKSAFACTTITNYYFLFKTTHQQGLPLINPQMNKENIKNFFFF